MTYALMGSPPKCETLLKSGAYITNLVALTGNLILDGALICRGGPPWPPYAAERSLTRGGHVGPPLQIRALPILELC